MLDLNEDILIDEFTNCQICFNSYDEQIRKPFSIFNCGHTFCIISLYRINLVSHWCPQCKNKIESIAPNWQSSRLLSLIYKEKNIFRIKKNKKKNTHRTTIEKKHVGNISLLFQKYFELTIILFLISLFFLSFLYLFKDFISK
jgi:hypothetical protein